GRTATGRNGRTASEGSVSRIAEARARAGLRPIADDGGAWGPDAQATRLFLAVRAERKEASDDLEIGERVISSHGSSTGEREIQIEEGPAEVKLGNRDSLYRPKPAVDRTFSTAPARPSVIARAASSRTLWILFGLAVLATVIGTRS